MRRGLIITLGVVGALLALVAGGAVLLSSPEGARRAGEMLMSQALHRPVRFASLQAHLLSPTPTFHAEGVVVTSPSRITPADLLHARTLDAEFDWSGLLAGKMRFRRLALGQPELHLVRLGPGVNNYTFGPGGAGSALRSVTSLSAAGGRLIYEDPQRHLLLTGAFAHSGQGGSRALNLQGGGVANGQPFVATAAGAPLNGRSPTDPYAFSAHMVDGETDLVFSGVTQKPFDFRGFDLKVQGRGPNLADLHYLLGVDPVNSPPFSVTAHATKSNHLTRFTEVVGRIGDSDLAGDITADDRGPRRRISATLRARTIHTGDVAALLTHAPDHAATRRQAGHAGGSPDKPFDLKGLRAKDLDLDIEAQSVAGGPLPISGLKTHIQLTEGRLAFAPLDLQVGGGQARATLVLDARGPVPRGFLTVGLSQARLAAVRPDLTRTLDGRIAAHLSVSGAGASPAALLADLSGRTAIVVTDGHLARGPADALGGNLFKSLIAATAGAHADVRLQCAGGTATIAHGLASLDEVRLFTDVGETDAGGTVDFGRSSVSIRLTPRPRPGDLAQTPAPISITGPLAKPKVSADMVAAAKRQGVGGVIKLAMSPVTSLIPGRTQDFAADCARMAASVK